MKKRETERKRKRSSSSSSSSCFFCFSSLNVFRLFVFILLLCALSSRRNQAQKEKEKEKRREVVWGVGGLMKEARGRRKKPKTLLPSSSPLSLSPPQRCDFRFKMRLFWGKKKLSTVVACLFGEKRERGTKS